MSLTLTLLAVIGINIFAGLLLAELSLDRDVQDYTTARPVIFTLFSSLSIVLGIYILSYPEENPEWARWSANMLQFGYNIFPNGSEFARFYPALGANILTLGIIFNSTAKRILSHWSICWLGKMSFAIYLLHAPLIRTLLTWMLYGASSRPLSPGQDEQGHDLPLGWVPLASRWVCFIIIPLFYVLLYRIAQVWTTHVDPWCSRVTNWVEEKAFREDSKTEKPLLLS